jgi:hypothetical protein
MLETMNLRQMIFEKLYLMLIEIPEGWLQYSVAARLQQHTILEGWLQYSVAALLQQYLRAS